MELCRRYLERFKERPQAYKLYKEGNTGAAAEVIELSSDNEYSVEAAVK